MQIEEVTVQLGDIVHLQFSVGSNITEAVGKVVYIDGLKKIILLINC
jgi:hypothetical protein